MKCKRGDVILVLFPDSNLRTAKRRPALVVQTDNLNSGINQTIVAMVSSNMTRAGHPSRIAFLLNSPEALKMGLKTDSVVMTDNLATILDNEVDRVIGFLVSMSPIDRALRHTLGI